MIVYSIKGIHVEVEKIYFVPIEFLSWSCLTLGALGWGQIQIVNSSRIKIDTEKSRKKWMIKLCDTLFEFYPSEIAKINERIAHFKKVKKYWFRKRD